MQKDAAPVTANSNGIRLMSSDDALDRWFKEKWVDISKKDKSGKHPPCGRKDADKGKYPKCRPSKRVSKKTPKTSKEMSKAEKEKANRAKRKAEKKPSKSSGGKARKPKRAPTIKRKKTKKKSFEMITKEKLRKLSSFLYKNNLKEEVLGISSLLQKLAKEECPPATQDIKINTKNRNSTRDNHAYGPLNPSKPSEEYWSKIAEKWDASIEEAMSSRCYNCVAFDISPRMKDCMPLVDEGLNEKYGSDIPGFDLSENKLEFGYCWMHHFKCLSARTCDTWAGGGPIDEDDKSYEWQEKNKAE